MNKRLIVFCDGTWNFADQVHGGVPSPTNITLLHRHLAPIGNDGVPHWGYYHEGVGVKRFERLRGGVGGFGLSEHVRDVYTWLAQNYKLGDEIFLFGFSRGAYTARSAVGMIRNCGVVQHELGRIDPSRVEEAYSLYRRANGDPTSAEPTEFRRQYSVAEQIPIKFVGVFDTVGALGIPISGSRLFNALNQRYKFHNVQLSSWVENAYHALAIDERRGPFVPALWTKSKDSLELGEQQTLEQVWFAGVHSDIGGGYHERELAELTLRWMLDRAASHGFGLEDLELPPVGDPTVVESRLHDSFGGFYRFLKPSTRVIGEKSAGFESAASTAKDRVERDRDYEAPNLRTYLSGNPRITPI